MKILVIIPARGGSKGIPHKNIKPLNGKPLIHYTIDVARGVVNDEDICVSTDDPDIIKCVEDYGLKVPFVRPAELATDTAGTYEVLLHALDFYEKQGRHYDVVLLLQNTSPYRTAEHVKEALKLYRNDIDMVVSVNKTRTNPYYNCFEEDQEGFLKKTLDSTSFIRRQDAPITYEYNGAIYVINPEQMKKMPLGKFTRRVKYIMDDLHSVDLDNMIDWKFAEFIQKEGLV
jgi:N-acylneuraminate cytidylyltransferase